MFAFAITRPGRPEIRPAFAEARRHLTPIVVWGAVVGLLLAFSTTVVTRWGRPWFTISLGIAVGLMMVCYVAVPSRLIGVKPTYSRREKLVTSVVSGVLGATVSTPPYVLGRVGLLMLGSDVLLIPGIVLIALGVTLQAGATGAVRAIKMSVKLDPAAAPTADPPPERGRMRTATRPRSLIELIRLAATCRGRSSAAAGRRRAVRAIRSCRHRRRASQSMIAKPARSGIVASTMPTKRRTPRATPMPVVPDAAITRMCMTRQPGVWPVVAQKKTK